MKLLKPFKPDDFESMLIDATWPIIQMEKATKIANEIYIKILIGNAIGTFIGMMIVKYFIWS